jgi:hypothetical protein
MLLHVRTCADPAAEREIRRTNDFGGGICSFDHGGIFAAQIEDGVVIGAVRQYIAVRVAPAAGLIVELVIRNTAGRRSAEGEQQMIEPVLLELRAVVDVIGVDIFVDELCAAQTVGVIGACDTVAAVVPVGMDIRIGRLLGAVD